MFFQIPRVCKCHVRGGGIESLDAKIIMYHSCENNAIAWQRSPVGKGLGKRLQGMLRPIDVIQKRDRFGLGYKPDKRERQRFLEEKRQKRIAIFLEKERDNTKMDIPPLSSSFLSTGFINPDTIQGDKEEVMVDIAETFESLSIDMVEVKDQEAKGVRLPPFPRG